MYVCMCVCIYACMYVCIYVYMPLRGSKAFAPLYSILIYAQSPYSDYAY